MAGWNITHYIRNQPNFLEMGPDCIEAKNDQIGAKLRLDMADGVINLYVKTAKKSREDINTLLQNLPQGGRRVIFSRESPTVDDSHYPSFVVYKPGRGYDFQLHFIDPSAGTIEHDSRVTSQELLSLGIDLETNCDAVLSDLLDEKMPTHFKINRQRLCVLSFDQGNGNHFLVLWNDYEMSGILHSIDNLITLPPEFKTLLDDMAMRAKSEEHYTHNHLVNHNKQERRLKLWECLLLARLDYGLQTSFMNTAYKYEKQNKDLYLEMIELEKVNRAVMEAEVYGTEYNLPADLAQLVISSATRKPLLKQSTFGEFKMSTLTDHQNNWNRKKAFNLSAGEYNVDEMTALQDYLNSVSDQLVEVKSQKDHTIRQYNPVNQENASVIWIESKSIISTAYQDTINVFELLRCRNDVAFRASFYSCDLSVKTKIAQFINNTDWMGMTWTLHSSRQKKLSPDHKYIVLDINHCKTPTQYKALLSCFDSLDSIISFPADFKSDSAQLLQEDPHLTTSAAADVKTIGLKY
jgi:hypothetical protein